ncbi:MAG TPA: DNA polymerase III subunit alpha, partial [Sphaerochaeta sp.]|nr:DNA polymerase III subunit alpha [Sphaerochaeta sp.]
LYAFVESQAAYEELCMLLSLQATDPTFSYRTYFTHHKSALTLASFDSELLATLASIQEHLYAAIAPDMLSALRTARTLELPLLACERAYLASEAERPLHRLLRAIGENTTVDTISVATSGGILADPATYARALAPWPEARSNAAALRAHDPFPSSLLFPAYPSSDVDSELRERVYRGAELRYGELSDAILGRLEYELSVIAEKGFSSYFLVMDDIVSFGTQSCGRGSAAASAVAYSLGISAVDPLAHNLYFERFLSSARVDPPDIDVDFAYDERDAIFTHLFATFGEAHTARIANHLFFRRASALRESARAYGLHEGELRELEEHPTANPLYTEISRLALALIGLPRGIGLHCGGVVMTEEPIRTHAPVMRSACGYPLLIWEKDGAEAAGFVKIDLLGNRSLAVVRDTLINLEEQGIVIDPHSWRPAEDKQTIATVAAGETMGVFYIESPAMRQLQKRSGRGDFTHVVIHSSLIRPAANTFINAYLDRVHGASWEPLHPDLEHVLAESYGILCYQEDVSKIAVALASFSEAEADGLRKVVTKKERGTTFASYKERFFSGCRANGIEESTIQAIWEMVLSFEGYSFCKAHSASYAMLSFQSAYLRTHYPAAFMAAVLSHQGGYYNTGAYISEARRMGLSIRGPDINESEILFRAEGDTIICGLLAVAHLSSQSQEAILTDRKHRGPYTSLHDVATRLVLSRQEYLSLAQAGVFDTIAGGLDRPAQLRVLLTQKSEATTTSQLSLFGVAPPPPPPLPTQTAVQEVSLTTLEGEYTALGFLRSYHPLVLYQQALQDIVRTRARDMTHHVGRTITLVGYQITRKQVRTKGGELMSFISFEDESALYETILFPQVHRQYAPLLREAVVLLVTGKVMDDRGALLLEVSSLSCPFTKKSTHYRYG